MRVCVCGCVHVRACVSGQYHQYCSAHDEWLIMKLCMYVRYHTANNVSNFGGDPVTQLNLINLIVCVCVCVLVCKRCELTTCVWLHTNEGTTSAK